MVLYQIQDMVESLQLDFLHQVHKAVAGLGEGSHAAAGWNSLAVGDNQCLAHNQLPVVAAVDIQQ